MNRRSRWAAWPRRPWLVVATVGLIAGFGFVLVIPPLGGYDEPVHFLRAEQVSRGQLIASHHGKRLGGEVPIAMQGDLIRMLLRDEQIVFHARNAPSNPFDGLRGLGDPAPRGGSNFLDFPSAAVYSPVAYAPASVLMAIGRGAGASTLLLLYLGRIGCLLGTIGLLTLATKRMPTRAWAWATVALLPVVIVQAAMLSADGITLALTLLVLALALRLAATARDAVTTGQLVEIAVATVALGFAKPPYILVAFALAIPWRRHAHRVRVALTAAMGLAFTAAVAWGLYATSVYVAPTLPKSFAPEGVRQFTVYNNVDPKAQERFVLHHPWFFAQTVGHTVSAYWGRLLKESVGQVPLWSLPAAFAIVAFVLVGASLFAPEPEGTDVLGWRSRALLVGIAGALFVALMAIAYTGWNAVGSPRVEAFQGRYLLPIIPLLLVAVPAIGRRAAPESRRWLTAGLAIASPTLLAAAGIALCSHLY